MTARRALWLVIGLSTVLRLVFAASVGAYTNEAYYYMYARNLDWSYFDHPPMVGLVAFLGLKLTPGLPLVFGLRLGFVLMLAGSTWLLARITERAFGGWSGVLAALGLNATIYYGLLVGTFAEPDGPLLFFWLLTLDRLLVALERPESLGAWAGVGLGWGCAMLSKYYAVMLPAGVVLYAIVKPPARRCLRMPGPYLATLLGVLLFSPVIAWNAAHDWASFLYQGNRAGGFHGLQPDMFLEALVGQVLFLTPWIWGVLVAILFGLLRKGPRQWSDVEAFLMCEAVPVLCLFMSVATFRRIMAHWPIVGFVALMPMLGRTWALRLEEDPVGFRRKMALVMAVPVVLGTLFVVQARTGLFQDAQGRILGLVPSRRDPTVDTIRWEQIARELKRRGLPGDPGSFLFTDCWKFSAELAMATERDAPVACFHRDSRSFTFWSRPEDWLGRSGIFVSVEDGMASAENYAPWFTRIEPIASFPIVRAGVPLQTVKLYRCVTLTDPFPFGYRGDGPLPLPGVARKSSRTPGKGKNEPALATRPRPLPVR